MKSYLNLITLSSLILGQSVKVTSPSEGDTWNAENSLKVMWEKEGISDKYKWAEVTLINAKDEGIEWKFDYVTSIGNSSEFYLPTNAFIEGSNYKVKVGVFSADPTSSPVDGESGTFSITNGVNFDTIGNCGNEWKFTNVNSTTPWDKYDNVNWKAPGKLTPANRLDLRVKSVDDANFTYTEIDLPAGGYEGSSYIGAPLEDGKKYKLQGIFHYSRKYALGNPLCKLESEEFIFKKRN